MGTAQHEVCRMTREMKMERAVRLATTPKDRADLLLVADTLGHHWLYQMPSVWRIVKAYDRLG